MDAPTTPLRGDWSASGEMVILLRREIQAGPRRATHGGANAGKIPHRRPCGQWRSRRSPLSPSRRSGLAEVAPERALQRSISGEQNLDLLIYEKVGALPSGSLQPPWERRWNAALLHWEELKHKAAEFQRASNRVATPEQKAIPFARPRICRSFGTLPAHRGPRTARGRCDCSSRTRPSKSPLFPSSFSITSRCFSNRHSKPSIIR